MRHEFCGRLGDVGRRLGDHAFDVLVGLEEPDLPRHREHLDDGAGVAVAGRDDAVAVLVRARLNEQLRATP